MGAPPLTAVRSPAPGELGLGQNGEFEIRKHAALKERRDDDMGSTSVREHRIGVDGEIEPVVGQQRVDAPDVAGRVDTDDDPVVVGQQAPELLDGAAVLTNRTVPAAGLDHRDVGPGRRRRQCPDRRVGVLEPALELDVQAGKALIGFDRTPRRCQ